jgi:hypothetical protein
MSLHRPISTVSKGNGSTTSSRIFVQSLSTVRSCAGVVELTFRVGSGRVQQSTVPISAAPVGLLLDIDGPIASPDTRTIAIPRILDHLVTLTAAGVPIAFITGRSDTFVRDVVIGPLLAAGLSDALRADGAVMLGIFEKGAAWAPIGPEGMMDVEVDISRSVPQSAVRALREAFDRDFTGAMFWDETKRAMVSVEQHIGVPRSEFQAAQAAFNDVAFAVLRDCGIGVSYGSDSFAPDDRSPAFRVEPTIISTDIESTTLDKDAAAERALDYFAERVPLPALWRSVGDSRSDYLMADHVHARGLEVAHVDVRPSDGILDRPYRVIVEGDLTHDDAGAAFLDYWVKKVAPA